MKRSRAPIVVVGALCVSALLAPSAFAKFTLHNGNDVTQTDVVAGSEFNTCGNRISGRIGWASPTFIAPPLVGNNLAAATSPAEYEVFQFPPGYDPSLFSTVEDGQGDILRWEFNDNGTIVVAPQVLAFTTDARTLIQGGPIQQQPSGTDPLLFIYSDVAFSEAIAPAAPVGATFGMKPQLQASLRYLNVVDCTPPPTEVIASIDAQPLQSVNRVNPSSSNPTLAILVKGRANLNVTTIATAKVGGASPVTTGIFGVLSRPHDVTGDGRKDRVYFFRPNQTGLTCTSTTVTIAGTLNDAKLWKGTDSIKPIC